MKSKALKAGLLAVAMALLVVAPAARAQPTVEEVRASVAAGVAWLADQQYPDGRWSNWESCALTGLALKKLMHHAVDWKWGLGLESPFDEANPYRPHIELGLSWLFVNCAGTMPISVQPHGNPDTDGDGIGVYFGSNQWHRSYTSGIALMAMCETVEFDRIVDVGPLTGWTYGDVARDLMDYLAYGQNDAGWERGGWGYYDNYVGWSDNSNAGYVTLGLGFAEVEPPDGCDFVVPPFVKDELNLWIDYIQNDVDGDSDDGGSGYIDPNGWVNILKTGNLLQQMRLVGDEADSGRVLDALDYLERYWNDPSWDPGWKGSPGVANYQATFTAMKGLTSLDIKEFGALPIDWATDFETTLLAEQLADGSWPITDWDYGGDHVLSTIWALLTLQRVAPPPHIPVPFDIKPQSCRNPLEVKGGGVVPAAILGTGEFDVTEVDVATLLLEGVAPLRWALEDVATPYEPFLGKMDAFDCTTEGPDGYLDLTLKFDKKELVAALGPVEDGDVLVLTLTGNLLEEFNGRAILGEDVVVILK